MAAKPAVLKDKLKEVVAEQILDAAEAELAGSGLAATSMAAIAQRAGVSVGTLYNYFKDKDVLLATLLATRRQEFGRHIEDAMRSYEHLPFEENLQAIVQTYFQIFDQKRNFLRIVLSNEKPKEPSSKTTTPMTQFIERFRPLTQKGVAAGVLAPDDADLYPSALAALIRSVMIQRLDDLKRPFQEATPFVVRIFLEGARKRT